MNQRSLSLDLVALRLGDLVRRLVGLVAPRRVVTLHHLACSGGTIITKCLATMPGALVLSEIHPERAAQPAFHALSQLQRGYGDLLKPRYQRLIRGHFRREIVLAHGTARSLGRQLIVRDHTHVDFAWRRARRSALFDTLLGEFRVTPIVTVRDPREVWLSLRREGWFDGTPDDLCQAQLALLDAFPGAPFFRYEDFTSDPVRVMREICVEVGVPFAEGFEERLSSITHLTGESGRKSEAIEPREPKPIDEPDRLAFERSVAFRALLERQGLDV